MDNEVDIIRKLRSHISSQQRLYIISQLANLSSLTALEELIKVAKRSRRQWNSFRRFTVEDQLSALSALGKTRSRIALTYLRRLIAKERVITAEYWIYQGIDPASNGFVVEIKFPDAPRAIRKLLNVRFDISAGSWQQISLSEAAEEAKSRLIKENTCYQVVINSIKELETTIS
ncbi:MAG TPA: hypothetical protein VJ464_08175 [Blastocatellia bacterium]|nr:hypothetical protein [Blastocatellia bacterium]